MVEAAVVISVVLLLVMGAVQVGLAYHTVQRADATAARAVAAAQVTGGSAAAGQQAAADHLAGAPLEDPSVSVTRGAEVVTASVSADVPRLVPGLTWRITRTAEAPTERFIPEPERQ